MFELAYAARRDRSDLYCQRQVVRQALLNEPNASVAGCAAQLRAQLSNCSDALCPRCVINCSSSTARSIASAWSAAAATRPKPAMAAFEAIRASRRASCTAPCAARPRRPCRKSCRSTCTGQWCTTRADCSRATRSAAGRSTAARRGGTTSPLTSTAAVARAASWCLATETPTASAHVEASADWPLLHVPAKRPLLRHRPHRQADPVPERLLRGSGGAFDTTRLRGRVDVRYDLLVSSCDNEVGFRVIQGVMGCAQRLFGSSNCGLALAAPTEATWKTEVVGGGFRGRCATLRRRRPRSRAPTCTTVSLSATLWTAPAGTAHRRSVRSALRTAPRTPSRRCLASSRHSSTTSRPRSSCWATASAK